MGVRLPPGAFAEPAPADVPKMKLEVLLHPEADGGYSVAVTAMPGCHSQGDTLDEALANIREAADLWIEVQADRALREARTCGPQSRLTDACGSRS